MRRTLCSVMKTTKMIFGNCVANKQSMKTRQFTWKSCIHTQNIKWDSNHFKKIIKFIRIYSFALLFWFRKMRQFIRSHQLWSARLRKEYPSRSRKLFNRVLLIKREFWYDGKRDCVTTDAFLATISKLKISHRVSLLLRFFNSISLHSLQ